MSCLRACALRSDVSGNDGDRLGEESSTYENGDMRIDYSAGCVYISDVEIHLTPIEYKLLCLLAKNTGKVLTHNYILKEVWEAPLRRTYPRFVFIWQHCAESLKKLKRRSVYPDACRHRIQNAQDNEQIIK